MNGRDRWVVGGAVGLPLVLVLTFVGFMLFYDGRRDIDLASWAHPDDAWTQSMMPGAGWATDELCGPHFPCIQAVTSDTLTLYRFDKRAWAVAAAKSFGEDGYLTGWIAVRYEPGGLSPAQRGDFEYGISCINTWVGEEGQDC